MDYLKNVLRQLASLKLTVVLFALAMFLIFAGTLAQVHRGIWTVMKEYFRSLVVWIDLQLFVPGNIADIPGAFPFPGGFVIGGLLIINLLAAHLVRFKLTRKRVGILLIHFGVALLLLGELITAIYAQEGTMSIDEGSYAQYTEDSHQVELAIIDTSNPDHDMVVVVPASIITSNNAVIRDPQLPFDITVRQWMGNSKLFAPKLAPEGLKPIATHGFGKNAVVQEIPRVTGVESQQVDLPSAHISLSHQGEHLGDWLVSLHIIPQAVQVANKTYRMALRFKRTYKPYTMYLIDFRHDKFIGTETPRNFSSLIRLVDPTNSEDREVLIYMNHPLRYAGETFYQSAYKLDDTGTILMVVRNPGWLLPYISCTLLSLGMLIHFGQLLITFVRRSRA